MNTTFRRVATMALLFAALVIPLAHSGAEQEAAPAFELTAAMIPMRDGVKLNTHIFIPKNQREPLPLMLERTPYQAPNGQAWAQGKYKALAVDGYVFVFQDIRGRYKSEGQFVM